MRLSRRRANSMSIQTKSSSLLPTKTRSAHRRKQSKRCAALLQSAQLYSDGGGFICAKHWPTALVWARKYYPRQRLKRSSRISRPRVLETGSPSLVQTSRHPISSSRSTRSSISARRAGGPPCVSRESKTLSCQLPSRSHSRPFHKAASRKEQLCWHVQVNA